MGRGWARYKERNKMQGFNNLHGQSRGWARHSLLSPFIFAHALSLRKRVPEGRPKQRQAGFPFSAMCHCCQSTCALDFSFPVRAPHLEQCSGTEKHKRTRRVTTLRYGKPGHISKRVVPLRSLSACVFLHGALPQTPPGETPGPQQIETKGESCKR